MMFSVSCFLKNPFSWLSILGLVLAGGLGFGLFSSTLILTSILASSAIFFKFSKQKPGFQADQTLQNDIILTSDQEISPKPLPVPEDEAQEHEQEQEQEQEGRSKIDEIHITRSSSPATLSENESLARSSTTSDDSELNFWQLQDNLLQSSDYSDGSISDDDSFIEIALPSGQYISHKKEEDHHKYINPQKKFQDFVPGTFFKQHGGLMELLAELNEMNIEEENLIEIDILMGSIKCPRFEVEA
ncbi:uncharacterized protein LOC126656370 [Mercurialis annua]|uniref:uncharacterized protein LOC126656370 n=1 Tax=Mercurialis annua TaxID=3986 RepID=UPI00215EFF11|nr:uncharacterized protein LOC126656370 [Mercurialis annua]